MKKRKKMKKKQIKKEILILRKATMQAMKAKKI